ncbi:MAG: hypothetical protein QMD94_02480 [Candidatus Omnitrophota bacterium]|nr:hypothetical protein [Candidatus Omnitrophota bacterium]
MPAAFNEKKEFPKKAEFPPTLEKGLEPKEAVPPKGVSKFFSKILGVIKLFFGLSLLPVIYAALVSFLNEISLIDKNYQNYFWLGIAVFLAVHLFVWEPVVIYNKGHRVLEIIFNFFQPLVKFAPYVLPIYTILIFIIYGPLSFFIHTSGLTELLLFFAGFTTILHLTFSAKTIRSKKGDFLKANYIFGFSFIFIINLFILAVCFNLTLEKFSLVNFVNNLFKLAKVGISAISKQLFVN